MLIRVWLFSKSSAYMKLTVLCGPDRVLHGPECHQSVPCQHPELHRALSQWENEPTNYKKETDGQDHSISIDDVLEILQSFTKSPILFIHCDIYSIIQITSQHIPTSSYSNGSLWCCDNKKDRVKTQEQHPRYQPVLVNTYKDIPFFIYTP